MITYTNVIDAILQGVENLLETEFALPVSFVEHEGTESILLLPVSDELVEYNAASQTRAYTISVEYRLVQNGEINYDHMTKRGERIKRLLVNNSKNGTTWYNGLVSSVAYGQEEEKPENKMVTITYTCNYTEVY